MNCIGKNGSRGAVSLESFYSYVEAQFDGLKLETQRCQADTAKLMLQLQDQMTRLETQVQMKLRQDSARGNNSARGPNSARAQKPELVLQLPPPTFQKGAMNGNAELVPLLSPEGCERERNTRSASKNTVKSCVSDAPILPSAVKSRFESGMTFQQRLKIAQDGMQEGKVKQSDSVRIVTAFLEDPESSQAAMYYSQFMLWFLIFAILVGLLPFADLRLPVAFADEADVAIDSILFLEILVRCIFCPNFKAFLLNAENLIDSLSAVPLAVIFLMSTNSIDDTWGNACLLPCVAVIRFLRLVRRFPKMQILISAFKNCLEALPVLLYTMAVMAVIFTSAIYLVEPRDNIATLSESAWLVLSTISTVGYGDVTPVSRAGTAFASVLMVVSPLYMAMPFSIIGYNFTIIWGNRAQIMLLNGTRDRLAKWGFGAYEIPRLFELFDLDESAEIDLQEFLLLLKEMEIGFREDDVIELFKAIDKDSGGTIDEKEFVKTLYPAEYRYMFGKKKVKDMVLEDQLSE